MVGKFGEVFCQKNVFIVVLVVVVVGLKGEKVVLWLKLNVIEGVMQDIKEIYCVDIVGGSLLVICKGLEKIFMVEYVVV